MLIADRSFLKSDRRFREIWKRGGRGDSGASGQTGGGSTTPPAVSGDNYAFVDVDAPSQDIRFALKDKAVTALDYVIYVLGASGAEQLNIEPGFDYPDAALFDLSTPGYEFSVDGYFKLVNKSTFAHFHYIAGYDGLQIDIGGRTASNPTSSFINPGLNYKFVTTPTVSLYLRDFFSGLWVKPWIVLSSGVAVIQLDPT